MRKLIFALLVLGIFSCKKKETPNEETKTTTPPITSVPDKTVSISCQTACGGQLRVSWEWDYNTAAAWTDSIYNYTPTTVFTKTVKGDSIRMYFYSTACSSCGPCANQVTLYVNGIVKQSWSNDMGAVWYHIAL